MKITFSNGGVNETQTRCRSKYTKIQIGTIGAAVATRKRRISRAVNTDTFSCHYPARCAMGIIAHTYLQSLACVPYAVYLITKLLKSLKSLGKPKDG